jgi:hypothetical protein
MDARETWKVGETLTVSLVHDEDCGSPRDYDNLGTMVCWHRNYHLGDTHDYQHPDTFLEWFRTQPGNRKAVLLTVYMFEHGGVALSTGDFGDPWDSGQVGWIYALPERIREDQMCKKITKKVRANVEHMLVE